MSGRRPLDPPHPRWYRLHVVRTSLVGASFRRVTVAGDDLAAFTWLGFDHWFRLFTLHPGQTELHLPTATSKLWYPQWLALAAHHRPHCSNYTVRAFRPEDSELDIDFVLHRNAETGELEGRAAIWADGVRPGDPLGILDQGRLFNPPEDTTAYVLAADESGLPAAEGILASLPANAVGTAVLEVPDPADRRDLMAPARIQVTWAIRSTGAVPGSLALSTLKDVPPPDPRSYAFAVGESGLATGARRHLAAAGLPTDRITFSGFWKH